MSSPAEIPFRSIIHFSKNIKKPIYLQVVNHFVDAIRTGTIPAGSKLPGSRVMSELLCIHRQTIVVAYRELEAQGWIEILPNKGTFVIAPVTDRPLLAEQGLSFPTKTAFGFRKSNIFDNPYEQENSEYYLDDGIPDIRLTHFRQLSRYYSANLNRKTNLRKLQFSDQQGNAYFKQQLVVYLNKTRGLNISTDHILITRSPEMSLYLASELLFTKEDTIVVGELSYFAVNMTFQKSGANIITIPVDENGLDISKLDELCNSRTIRAVYLTPHHHYPTTVTLTAKRRLELLALTRKHNFILLEDDYDYEFRFDKTPVLPIASMDKEGSTVYIGSFGKSLTPGFRTGYIVAPANLISELEKQSRLIDRHGDLMMEFALGEMIEDGEIYRYTKKSLKTYHARRDHFIRLFGELFGNQAKLTIPQGGLACWVQWPMNTNLLQLVQYAKALGLFIPKYLLYQTKELSAMRIGFGRMQEDEMSKSLSILHQAFQAVRT